MVANMMTKKCTTAKLSATPSSFEVVEALVMPESAVNVAKGLWQAQHLPSRLQLQAQSPSTPWRISHPECQRFSSFPTAYEQQEEGLEEGGEEGVNLVQICWMERAVQEPRSRTLYDLHDGV